MEVLSHNINEAIFKKNWIPIQISQGGPALSHLFFADDLVCMSNVSGNSHKSLMTTLSNFCNWSGQSINLQKSKILFSNNCPNSTQKLLSSFFNIRKSNDFGKYLVFQFSIKIPQKRISALSWITFKRS